MLQNQIIGKLVVDYLNGSFFTRTFTLPFEEEFRSGKSNLKTKRSMNAAKQKTMKIRSFIYIRIPN